MRKLISYMTIIVLVIVFSGSRAVSAQENTIVDTLSIGVGVSLDNLDSTVRLDSKSTGTGTVIDYEKDLGFAKNIFIPNAEIQWMPIDRHRFYVSFTQYNRSKKATVNKVIDFGDLVVPINATVKGRLDIDEYKFGYMFYPLFKERWALGVGAGVRLMYLDTSLKIISTPPAATPTVTSDSADATGPLPFMNLEYRYALSPKWRLTTTAGYFTAKISRFKGEQILFGASIEHLVIKRFSWGIMADYSIVDVRSKKEDFRGKMNLDIARLGVFAKVRW
jgi:hypothetical protein